MHIEKTRDLRSCVLRVPARIQCKKDLRVGERERAREWKCYISLLIHTLMFCYTYIYDIWLYIDIFELYNSSIHLVISFWCVHSQTKEPKFVFIKRIQLCCSRELSIVSALYVIAQSVRIYNAHPPREFY